MNSTPHRSAPLTSAALAIASLFAAVAATLVIPAAAQAAPPAGNVVFADDNLRLCAAEAIGGAGATEVTVTQAQTLTGNLNCAGRGIVSLGGIEHFTGLSGLGLDNNQIGDLAAGTFAGMSNLIGLSLDGNQISTIAPGAFSGLDSLQNLFVGANPIASLGAGAFAGLTAVVTMRLTGNRIASIDPAAFTGAIALKSLYLDGNRLSDVSAATFAQAPALTTLSALGQNVQLGSITAGAVQPNPLLGWGGAPVSALTPGSGNTVVAVDGASWTHTAAAPDNTISFTSTGLPGGNTFSGTVHQTSTEPIPVPTPTLQLNAVSVMRGETLTLTGAGFPNAALAVWIASDPQQIGMVTPNGGAFTFSWTVPAAFPTGPHRISILDAGGAELAAIELTVGAVDPTNNTERLADTGGAPTQGGLMIAGALAFAGASLLLARRRRRA